MKLNMYIIVPRENHTNVALRKSEAHRAYQQCHTVYAWRRLLMATRTSSIMMRSGYLRGMYLEVQEVVSNAIRSLAYFSNISDTVQGRNPFRGLYARSTRAAG